MANTLTNLLPDLYTALDVVSRELVGFIPSVTRDISVDRVAVGQNVRSFIAPAATSTDITPGVTPPNDGDQTITNVAIAITKAKRVPISWNGEETRGVNNNGPGAAAIRANQIQQAMRTLVNQIETDIADTYVSCSRAYGTAGTTPFASTLVDPANVRKILVDNGCPASDLQLVIGSTAGAALRTLAQLTKVNESADTTMLRQGTLLDIHGFAIRESAQIKSVTKGTGTAYTSSTAGFAIGATSIAIITGTGTVLAGDVVTFAGDTNKYVVKTGVAAPGTIVLQEPGLQVAIAASAVAMTIGGNYAANMAFGRHAIVLAQRLPALPDGNDLAIDRTTITDDRSGLSFEVAMYAQYRQMQYEISCSWGVKVIKEPHTAILLG